MANYLLVYHGGGGMPETEAEGQAEMARWMAWFQGLGAAVVDGGNPVGQFRVVSGSSVASESPNPVSGYSVLSAGSIDEAIEMAKGCPIILHGGNVEVCETFNAG